MRIGTREQLEQALRTYLGENREGCFITLLTDTKMDQFYDPSFRSKKAVLDANLVQVCKCIGKKYFGRQYELGKTDHLIRFVSAVEVGGTTGRLHAHLVAAHQSNTTRSLDEIKDYLDQLWSRMYVTKMADTFVKVDPLDLSLDPIRYLTKQTDWIYGTYGDVNYGLH